MESSGFPPSRRISALWLAFEHAVRLRLGGGHGLPVPRQFDVKSAPTRTQGVISKDFLCQGMETYISKVTSAGQLTLPKKVRRSLGIRDVEFVEVAVVGRAAVIRRLREEDVVLRSLWRTVKKSGITRARLQEIAQKSRERTWKRRYAETVR